MKYFFSFIIIVLVIFLLISVYFYITKYKPVNDKLNEIKKERDALLVRVASIKGDIDDTIAISEIIPYTQYGREVIDSMVFQVEQLYEELDSQAYIGASVEIALDNFFDSDSITVWKPGGKALLRRIANIVKRSGEVNIVLSVHVDNVIPPEAEIYAIKTPWEVSAKRGVDLIRYISDSCDIGRAGISLHIFGDQIPKGDTTTEEGRKSSRRLILTIEEK